jgi:outer membrane protein assembly factor BamB
VTSTSPPAVESQRYKLCPTCQRLTPADSPRCYECWNDVSSAPVLSAHEGIRAIARQTATDLEEKAALAKRRAFWRRVRKVAIAFGAGVMTTVIYWTMIYSPPPPPPGSNPSLQTTVGDSTWPIESGGLSGARVSAVAPALTGGQPWALELGSAPATPMIASAEHVYLSLEDGRVVAIDARTGAEAWTHRLQNPPVAAPTLAAGRLYIPQLSGRVMILDAGSGEVFLETPVVPTSFTTSPMVVDGVVYLFGIGALVALDAETGARLWSQRIESNWAFVTPVLDGRYIAAATGDRTLIFDRLAGSQTYYYEFERAHPYSIVLADGTVYSLSARFGAAIDIESERPWWEGWRKYWNQFWIWGMAPAPPPPPSLWVTSRPPREGYPVAVAPDRLLVADATGDLRAISRADGSPLWQQRVEAIAAPPILTPAGLFLLHAQRLAIYNPENGELVTERALPGPAALESAIITSHGTYLLAEDGRLTALR